jgi:hypothetical protein
MTASTPLTPAEKPADGTAEQREAALVALDLTVRSYRDQWTHPMARWAVHRRGMRVVPFQKLGEAKAWVAATYGPVRWSRDEYPNGREVGVEWTPAAK